MTQTVLVIPEITEGPWVAPGLDRPLRFTVEVGDLEVVYDFTNQRGPAIEGWRGKVVSGQGQFLGKRVNLTPRGKPFGGTVVARIFADDPPDREIFSGICETEGGLE